MQMEGQIQQLYNGTEHSIIPPSGLWHYIENLYYPAKAKKKKHKNNRKRDKIPGCSNSNKRCGHRNPDCGTKYVEEHYTSINCTQDTRYQKDA